MGLSRCCSARRASRLGWQALLQVSFIACLAAASGARAEDERVLIHWLGHADSFRVRMRAALALVHAQDERAIGALEAALVDQHPAVREAAAVALGQIGTHRSVPALREAARDGNPNVAGQAKDALRSIAAREVIVRALATGGTNSQPGSPGAGARSAPAPSARSLAHVRYAVVLGEMRDKSVLPDARLPAILGERIDQELRKLDAVAVFSLRDMTEGVTRELLRHKVPTFRLEGVSRVSSESAGHPVRCDVSLLLMDEPERTLRGLLKGAATSSVLAAGKPGAQQASLVQQTLKSATHGAMANILTAIEAAAVRRDLGAGDIRAEASLR
jgi:HEAT repeat protein